MASRKTTSPTKTATPAKAPRKASAAKSSPAKATKAKPATATKARPAKATTARTAAGKTTTRKPATTSRKGTTAGKPTKAAGARKIAPSRAKTGRAKKGAELEIAEVVEPALEAPAAALAAAKIAAEAALDKKAENVVILDVAGLTGYADCFVIATGTSDRQVSAIADSIEEKMKKAGHRAIGVEGHGLGHWVLLDFGDVVAHVFYEEARALYDVEGLWADARRIPVE